MGAIYDAVVKDLNRSTTMSLMGKEKMREIAQALDDDDFAKARFIINEGGGAAFILAERKMLLRICGAEDESDEVTITNLQDAEKTRKRINRIHPIPNEKKKHFRKFWKKVGENLVTPCDPGSDPDIIWGCADPIAATQIKAGYVDNNMYFNEHGSGVGYYEDSVLTSTQFIHADALPFSNGDFVIKFDIVEVVSGGGDVKLNYTSSQEGVWADAFRADIRLEDPVSNGITESVIVDITIATDNGAGAPVSGTEAVRRVTFYSERTA